MVAAGSAESHLAIRGQRSAKHHRGQADNSSCVKDKKASTGMPWPSISRAKPCIFRAQTRASERGNGRLVAVSSF